MVCSYNFSWSRQVWLLAPLLLPNVSISSDKPLISVENKNKIFSFSTRVWSCHFFYFFPLAIPVLWLCSGWKYTPSFWDISVIKFGNLCCNCIQFRCLWANCEDRFYAHVFIHSSSIWLSYIHSRLFTTSRVCLEPTWWPAPNGTRGVAECVTDVSNNVMRTPQANYN